MGVSSEAIEVRDAPIGYDLRQSSPVAPAGYKQSEVGIIPEDWECSRFSEVTNLITCGVAATPLYVPEGKGVPFLSSTNVKNGRINWANYKFIHPALHESESLPVL